MSDRPEDQTQFSPETSTKDVAAEESKSVAKDAQQSGQAVAQTAKQEAQHVAGEATQQAKDLVHQLRSEASSQASGQQQRAAGGLRSLADELNQVAQQSDSGVLPQLARQAADRTQSVAGWLENREPADLLDEVRRYARRSPGTFLAIAAAIGVVGGRMTRGLRDEAQEQDQQRGLSAQGEQYTSGMQPAYSGGYQTYPSTGYGDTGSTAPGAAYAAPGATYDSPGMEYPPTTGTTYPAASGTGLPGEAGGTPYDQDYPEGTGSQGAYLDEPSATDPEAEYRPGGVQR